MNRYQPALPRVALSFNAVALSALTLGLSVLPALLGSVGHERRLEAVRHDRRMGKEAG